MAFSHIKRDRAATFEKKWIIPPHFPVDIPFSNVFGGHVFGFPRGVTFNAHLVMKKLLVLQVGNCYCCIRKGSVVVYTLLTTDL